MVSDEKEKMLRGELYNAADPRLRDERTRARILMKKFNESWPEETEKRTATLKELIPTQGADLYIEPPFYCDYGTNIRVGNTVYFNFNCTVLDVVAVTIGDNVFIGPSVQILTPLHPMNWKERATGLEYAKPVTIGSNVWIGGRVVICPGVNIGNRSVIGAGSIVTADIPDDVFAAGTPCRIIRPL